MTYRQKQVQVLRKRHCNDCHAFIPEGTMCKECGSSNYSNHPIHDSNSLDGIGNDEEACEICKKRKMR